GPDEVVLEAAGFLTREPQHLLGARREVGQWFQKLLPAARRCRIQPLPKGFEPIHANIHSTGCDHTQPAFRRCGFRWPSHPAPATLRTGLCKTDQPLRCQIWICEARYSWHSCSEGALSY